MSVPLLLKLDVLNLPKARVIGVGGHTSVTYYATVTIDMGGISFQAYSGFSRGLELLGLGLLGQSGFFENYNVEFLHRQKIFTVEKS